MSGKLFQDSGCLGCWSFGDPQALRMLGLRSEFGPPSPAHDQHFWCHTSPWLMFFCCGYPVCWWYRNFFHFFSFPSVFWLMASRRFCFESSFWLISSSSPIIGLGRNPEHPPNLARETTYKTVSWGFSLLYFDWTWKCTRWISLPSASLT